MKRLGSWWTFLVRERLGWLRPLHLTPSDEQDEMVQRVARAETLMSRVRDQAAYLDVHIDLIRRRHGL